MLDQVRGQIPVVEPAVAPKAEATIEVWVSEKCAALGPACPQPGKALQDECAANAVALLVRLDGKRAESKPAIIPPANSDRGECDVGDDLTVHIRNKRDSQIACITQCTDNQRLGMIAVRDGCKRRLRHAINRILVSRLFAADVHDSGKGVAGSDVGLGMSVL